MNDYLANLDPFATALWVLVLALIMFLVYLTALAIRLLKTLGRLNEHMEVVCREVQLTASRIRDAAERHGRPAQAPRMAKPEADSQGQLELATAGAPPTATENGGDGPPQAAQPAASEPAESVGLSAAGDDSPAEEG